MIGRMNLLQPALLSAFLSSCASSTAQDSATVASWSQFRGPGGLAVAEGQCVTADLSLERDVRWKTTVPAGSSSPCFTAERMFITGASGAQLSVVALDRESGAILWQRDFEGEGERSFDHVDSSPAMPSPCTDGERIYAYFGAYGVVALDLDGEVVWERRLPRPEATFGVGASPILAAGNLIVPRDGAKESAVLALDTATGEDVFRIERFGFIDSYATPFLWQNDERDELIITGTKQLCAYDPSGGEPLWSTARLWSSPMRVRPSRMPSSKWLGRGNSELFSFTMLVSRVASARKLPATSRPAKLP